MTSVAASGPSSFSDFEGRARFSTWLTRICVHEVPEETVKTRLFRARARLQDAILASLEPAVAGTYAFHLSRCDRVVDKVLRRIGAR